MKIAFVYDAVYPWIKGGAEKRIYEIGKRLAQKGNDVHLFGVKWWDGADVIRYDGMTLHGVCAPMELYVNGRRSVNEALIFSIKLPLHLLREKFDVIDVCAFPYFSCFTVKIVSIMMRKPMIITWLEVWGDYWYEYMGLPGLFGKLVEQLVAKLTCRSIALSEMTKRGLLSLGIDREKITIMPAGVDIKGIKNIPPSVQKCDILFAGRLIKEKNVDALLKAVDYVKKTIPSIRCHIIGGGPEKEHLKKLSSQLGLCGNVSFSDFLEYDEVISRIKSSKMLVLPSGREGFGIIILESYACGVPVITVNTRRNAAIELVDGTGFTVNLDPIELSDAILMLIKDPGVYQKMSESALNKVKEFDWDNIARQLLMLYEETIMEEYLGVTGK